VHTAEVTRTPQGITLPVTNAGVMLTRLVATRPARTAEATRTPAATTRLARTAGVTRTALTTTHLVRTAGVTRTTPETTEAPGNSGHFPYIQPMSSRNQVQTPIRQPQRVMTRPRFDTPTRKSYTVPMSEPSGRALADVVSSTVSSKSATHICRRLPPPATRS
jgi:hypothetical protein